ncbi:hypothetical protein SCYAM73S_01263 [Streptomyces cyaneofuscatus]
MRGPRRGPGQGRTPARPHGRAARRHRRADGTATGLPSPTRVPAGPDGGRCGASRCARDRLRRTPEARAPAHRPARPHRRPARRPGPRTARQDRHQQPPRLPGTGDLRRHRPHPRRQRHLVARQLPGRLRRPPLHRAQAPGHPLPRPHGGGTTRRRRPAHRTPVARTRPCCTAAAVARLRPLRRGDHRRPLPDEVWRLDWLLPPGKELVTPELLLTRVRETLAGWNHGTAPPYELLDTGVHTVHHRLARRWRADRVFLAGDAAHLLGALGTPPGWTRACATPTTSPGNWPWPGTTVRTRRSSTATRPSAARSSPPGCAPPTRRCRCCGAAEGCVPTSREPPGDTTPC